MKWFFCSEKSFCFFSHHELFEVLSSEKGVTELKHFRWMEICHAHFSSHFNTTAELNGNYSLMSFEKKIKIKKSKKKQMPREIDAFQSLIMNWIGILR